MRHLILIAMLTIGSVCSAELKLVIEAPTEQKLNGEPVLVNCKGTVANAKGWILPDSIKNKIIWGCKDESFGFWPPSAGEYRIILHGTDGVHLSYKEVVVTVTTSAEPPPDEDPVDPVPDDPPAKRFDNLERISLEGSLRADEPLTRSRLATALASVNYNQLPELVDREITQTIGAVLANRPRESDADWSSLWFRPILTELSSLTDDGTIENVDDLREAMKAVVAGLSRG